MSGSLRGVLSSISSSFCSSFTELHDEAEGADAEGEQDADDDGRRDAGPLGVVQGLGCGRKGWHMHFYETNKNVLRGIFKCLTGYYIIVKTY